jgi:hypothetical protein
MSKLALVHPDHLLDGARRGALAPEGWRALGAHLAGCRACAFEQAAASDFARANDAGAFDAPGQRGGPGGGHLDRLVEGALARADLAPRPRAAAPGKTGATARWVAAAVIAAAVGAVVVLGAPGRGARRDPLLAPPSDASLDAGAGSPLVGGDS